MTVTDTFWPAASKTLVIPTLRPIIPGMVETFLLVFNSVYGFPPAKRTAKIETTSKLASTDFKKSLQFSILLGSRRLAFF
jgi:hypothetical protein